MKAEDPLLQIIGLTLERQRSFLLQIPRLFIQQGEILSLIGPNGCGKTTLLMALAGLLRPRSGQIIFKGEPIHRLPNPLTYRRRIAMVFQESLLLNTTVWDNVSVGLKFRGVRKSLLREKVMENLERFHITHLSRRLARTLSGGEAQRTTLARAFAVEPEILLLDEPFSSLDLPSTEALMEDLETALRETRTTTVFATHNRTEALRLSDRMVVMNSGKIRQIGTPGHVMNHPADPFVASFVGMENISPGRVLACKHNRLIISVAGQEIEALGDLPAGTEVTVCLRPEKIFLSAARPLQESIGFNALKVPIRRMVFVGAYARVYLDGLFPRVAILDHREMPTLPVETGQMVWASFAAASVQLIASENMGA